MSRFPPAPVWHRLIGPIGSALAMVALALALGIAIEFALALLEVLP